MSKKLTLAAILILGTVNSHAQNYSSIMKETLTAQLGNQIKGYQIFDYPTDNWGLISSYRRNTKNFECAMLGCIGKENKGSLVNNLNMDGFAEIATGGGPIVIDDERKKTLALSFLLPKIYKILNISSAIDNEQVTNVKLNLGPVVFRKLIPSKYENYLKSLPETDRIKRLFKDRQLVFIAEDCIINSMSLEITVDRTTSTKIDASLGLDSTTIVSKIVDSGELGLKIIKSIDGKYTFNIERPVIFARLAKRQPSGSSLSSAPPQNYDNYPNVDTDKILLEKK